MQVQFLVETQTVSAEHGTDESHEGDVQCAMDLTSVSFIRGDSSQGVERAAPFSTAPSARLQCRPIRAATNPPSCLLLYLRSPFQREAQGQELPRFHALPARRRSSSPKDEDENEKADDDADDEEMEEEDVPDAGDVSLASDDGEKQEEEEEEENDDDGEEENEYERLRAANIERNRQARPKPRGAFVRAQKSEPEPEPEPQTETLSPPPPTVPPTACPTRA